MTNEVIILGKPNVGKSSIFNALVGKKLAIVVNEPGITRDLRRKEIQILDSKIILIDSAGISEKYNLFNKEILDFTISTIKKCDLILFVVDGKYGLNFEDQKIISLIRKFDINKLVIINKCESKINDYIENDVNKLGMGQPLYISAEHKLGILELKQCILDKIKKNNEISEIKNFRSDHVITIIGRSNSGKSTLINSLKGEKISITGETPNLTRDPVETQILWKNLKFKIFDTAGISKNTKKLDNIERLTVFETKRKIRLSEIIILTLDINDYFEKFNFKLMRLVVKESRCMIIVINKIDTIHSFSEEYIKNQIYKFYPQINNLPIYFISAKNKVGLKKLMNGIINFLPTWGQRVNTNKLNNWLKKLIINNPHPLYNGKEIKMKYITQVSYSPPKFVLFSNFPKEIKESYKRFLINNLKKTFNFEGVIVTLNFKKSNNPYEINKIN